MLTPKEILDFWFSDRLKKHWFLSTAELDKEILDKYKYLWDEASLGKLDSWAKTPLGSLALVIVLDQLPLNIFRDHAISFSTEKIALEIVKQAITKGFDKQLSTEQLIFLYMPFMHSEDIHEQHTAVKLYEQTHLSDSIKFAKHHRDIIKKFGRFPHRNKILLRKSTKQEEEYLNSKTAFLG